ncbi:MAG: NFACT family protein [Candidatus Micrarchaeota archaeon]|nr:NFACT family protein [Candidatus Micrarchaeota archaeon]
MRELYTLELTRLAGELRRIEGFYIDQFYELDKDRFRLKLSRKGEKANLQCLLPYSLNGTETIEIKESATNFSIAARKRIGGARIKRVEQLGNDRIIALRLERKGEEESIILEMFGKGNMVVVNHDMNILLAYRVHDFKDRRVRPNSVYRLPENPALDISQEGNAELIAKEMENAGKELTMLNYLTKRTGIGKMYIEEALARAEADNKSRIGDADPATISRIMKSMLEIVSECLERPRFIAYVGNGASENFSLCSIGKYSSMETRQFDSLEECLDFIYSNAPMQKEKANLEEERILASIAKQEKILEGIDSDMLRSREAGDYIMGHMHELNSMIEELKGRMKDRSAGMESVYTPDRARIISINRKDKTVSLSVEDSDQK